MIITRSPLRISLGGGGTDLPSYYREHGGFFISAAINKYVYVVMQDTFEERIMLRYSKIENVNRVGEIEHPIFREVLGHFGYDRQNLELTSFADIPAGTGLGSSGSFTTALVRAVLKHRNEIAEKKSLAEFATHIEMDVLGRPIGKQDQYIAAYGGLTSFEIDVSGKVRATSLPISGESLQMLQDNLLLFSTGITRSAANVLQDQDSKTKEKDPAMIANLHKVKELGRRSYDALTSGKLVEFGEIMNEHWVNKRKRSEAMSTSLIDEWYDHAKKNGAIGGKLIGAGGGGFLMFYTEQAPRLREAMKKIGLFELRCALDFEGTKVVQ